LGGSGFGSAAANVSPRALRASRDIKSSSLFLGLVSILAFLSTGGAGHTATGGTAFLEGAEGSPASREKASETFSIFAFLSAGGAGHTALWGTPAGTSAFFTGGGAKLVGPADEAVTLSACFSCFLGAARAVEAMKPAERESRASSVLSGLGTSLGLTSAGTGGCLAPLDSMGGTSTCTSNCAGFTVET